MASRPARRRCSALEQHGIWRLRAEILPQATPVLDRWLLRDARRRAPRAAVPEKEARRPSSLRLEAALDVGDVSKA